MLIKYILGNSSASVIRLFSFFILVMAFGAEKYGIIAYALAISIIVTNFSLLGAYNNSIRRIFKKEDKLQTIYIAILPSLLISIVFITLTKFLNIFEEEQFFVLVFVYISELFSTVYSSLFCALIVTLKQPIKSSISRLFISVGTLFVSIYSYYMDVSVVQWAVLNACVATFTLFLPVCYFLQLGERKENSDFSMHYLFLYVRDGIWITFSVLTRNIFFQVDKIVLSFFLSPVFFGLYSIAIRLVFSVYLLVSNYLSFYEPKFYDYGSNGVKSSSEFGKHVLSKLSKKIVVLIISLIILSLLSYLIVDSAYFNQLYLVKNIDLENVKLNILLFSVLILSIYPMAKFWICLYVLNGANLEKDRAILLLLLSFVGVFVISVFSLLGDFWGIFGVVLNLYVASAVLNSYLNFKVKNA
jgi:O-antigen/teichoic acid export membrane protein